MSASADRKRIEALHARMLAAPHFSKQRRHLRRALERAIRQAQATYGKEER